MEKLHTQIWVCKGWAGGVDMSHYVSIRHKVCNYNNRKMLTLQLDCRQICFQYWYHNIARNAASVVGLPEVVVILMPTDFHGEWSNVTLILLIFALHCIQAKWRRLASCWNAGDLTVWTAAKSVPLPHDCDRVQPMQQWLHSHWRLWECRWSDMHHFLCPCSWQEVLVSEGPEWTTVWVTSWTMS